MKRLLAAVAVLWFATAPAEAAGGRCPLPDGAEVLKRASGAVIYVHLRAGSDTPSVWGCRRGSRRVRMGYTFDGMDLGTVEVQHASLNGRHAAIVLRDFAYCLSYEVRSYDLRRGRLNARATVLDGYCDEIPGDVAVPDLVLSRSGSVGVTRRANGARAVVSVVAPGVITPVDAGPGIDLRSLRLEGRAMTWRHDGEVRAEALP